MSYSATAPVSASVSTARSATASISPIPTDPGGGATFFEFDREPTIYELLAVSTSGMESNVVAAGLIGDRAFRQQRLALRDAVRYLSVELDTLNYVLHTDDGPESPGHDVASFLRGYNELADAADGRRLRARTLRREVLLTVANPMLGYALFGIGRYLWNGRTDAPVPALSIAGVRYLPRLRYQLTPYGTEISIVNDLAGRIGPLQIEIRLGRAVHANPWGIGVRQRELTTWRSWRVDLGIELWRQPAVADLTADPLATVGELQLGAEVRGRFERPLRRLPFGSDPMTVIVDVGVKSGGFVPGEQTPARGRAQRERECYRCARRCASLYREELAGTREYAVFAAAMSLTRSS
jgi:hypothetical protein